MNREGARRRGAKGSWGSPLHLLECDHPHSSGEISFLNAANSAAYLHFSSSGIKLSPEPSVLFRSRSHANMCKESSWTTSQEWPFQGNPLVTAARILPCICIVQRRHSAHWSEKDPPDDPILFFIYTDSMNVCIIDTRVAACYRWYARRIKLCKTGEMLSWRNYHGIVVALY